MEWDLKMPPWDLSELEQNNGEANLSSVLGSSGSSSGRQTLGLECSVDLKLGGLGDFGAVDNWKEEKRVSTIVPHSLKRPRPTNGGNQKVSCLVDGCANDLSNCREYHRRHKVCEVHSKTPIVLVGGQEQRFCQQCSRFHLLVEFDDVKRSCRKRLDGHNRRRRKPQPDCTSGNFFQNHHEIRLSSYPQVFPTAATDTSWSTTIKSEENALYNRHNQPGPMHFINRAQQPPPHFISSFNQSFKEGKRFSFLHDAEADEMALGNRSMKTTITSAGESSDSKIIFSDGLHPVHDSDCALSLLSSSNQTSGINLGHMMPVDRIPMGQPLSSSFQYGSNQCRYSRSQAASDNVSPTGFLCSGVENEHLGTVLVSGATDADLNCQNIFNVGDEGSSDGASHSLHFSWQ